MEPKARALKDNLRDFFHDQSWTLKEAAEKTEVPIGTLSRLTSVAVKMPNTDTLIKLSAATGLSIEELLTENSVRLRWLKNNAVKVEDSLNSVGSIAGFIEGGGVPSGALPPIASRLRVFSSVHAGASNLNDVSEIDKQTVSGDYDPERFFIVIVQGDCMAPTVNHGERVLADCQAKPRLNNLVIISKDDELILRRMTRNGFEADNPGDTTIITNVKVWGVAIEVLPEPRKL